MASPGAGNIKVVVRVRPFNSREIGRKAQCIVSMQDQQTVLTPPASADIRSKASKAALEAAKTFAFDKSYWSFDREDSHYAGQENLFADLGAPLLDNAFQGYNNCIFAYGQTGSGKSYSMMGYGEETGVIPRICKNMFERIDALQADKNLKCTVEVSYLEIYNERVRDLLNPSTKGNLRVREHPATGPYVEDLAKLVVGSFPEIENLMDEGNKARTVAATNMNETSSRSHAVFTLTLTQKRHDVETNMDTEKVAKISLVDLAGSERATSTGATGARLKEGAEINRSLSTLGRVIAALADLSSGKKKNSSLVPYRDSVLTWLLKDSLGGNSLTAMIAAISPADINFEETLSTLRYADSAKRIKNHAVVNEDPNARMIRELKEELAQLRAKLSGSGGSGLNPDEQYSPDTPLDQQIVTITQADGTVKRVSKAEIAEQLNQSEKLYKDLNETWEEKLLKTEQIHKEREQALEELGISIEKGFIGLSTPKKMPHLVNLSDDPLLAECLVYNLKPGTTTVGNMESGANTEIRLNGSKILHDHCTFENVDGIVTVVPRDGAGVMVNGVPLDKPKRLRSGYRIILGDFHIFRFNHPQEARAERAEQGSLLRHSVIASQIGSPSPSPRPGHERNFSIVSAPASEFDGDNSSRAISPVPNLRNGQGRESDWDFARREAVSSIVGSEQKISSLSNEELDSLFEDLQRERAGRKIRPESRFFSESGEDSESISTFPLREKYMSNGTIDNFSLDTVLTFPGTPQGAEDDERLRQMKEEMQVQLEKQKEEYQTKLKAAEQGHVEIEIIRAEKEQMEASLRAVKEDMEKQLEKHLELERQLEELRKSPPPPPQPPRPVIIHPSGFTETQVQQAKRAFEQWRQLRYVSMASIVLQNGVLLKEAQVMSQQMDKHVVFQFCVVDVGHTLASTYDLVMNDITTEDDADLDLAPKPCVAVRVIDFKNLVIHVWSLQKLQKRVRQMRQMHQYFTRPEYSQHFSLENPFKEACMPNYSRIGDADVPLAAVFEARVQDLSLDVFSPYTNSVIGIVRLSLEPSSAEAPSSTLKFNVVMHDFVGFPEREGTEVHAQLFVPGVSEEVGANTTHMIKDFDEGAIRFESVHSMSLPLSSPRNTFLRVSLFAKITTMHMDKLLSWDDMRDSAPKPKQKRHNSRLPESEFYTEEKHDIFTRCQIQEISEAGEYAPVEVIQHNAFDTGVYQLHQGLQRRIVLDLMHSSAKALEWDDVNSIRVGKVTLLDPSGRASDTHTVQTDVPLKLASQPVVKNNADGTSHVVIVAQWDSSAHGSLLLDRTTADRYRVQITLSWNVKCAKLTAPMHFAFDMAVQIRARAYINPNSLLQSLWNTTRTVHSTTGMFSAAVRPVSAKRAADLWRMDSKNEYVKGEEMLSGWTPRGVSLIKDFLAGRKRRRRIAEMETARGVMSSKALSLKANGANAPDSLPKERQEQLLKRVLGLWTKDSEIGDKVLAKQNTEPPAAGAAFASTPSAPNPSLVATVTFVPKNPTLLKGGYLLTPDSTNTRWIRRYVELRKPYLHIFSGDGDELNVISLANSRVDHQPQLAKLLQKERMNVFAVFAPQNTYLFAARNEREKVEWILRIDQSYYGSSEETSPEEYDVLD